MKNSILVSSLIGAVESLAHRQLAKDKNAIIYWDAKVNDYRLDIEKRFKTLEDERDEADRRAGASERQQEDLKDSAIKRKHWLSNAKGEAGYDDYVSFDIVWAETLALARKAKEAGFSL